MTFHEQAGVPTDRFRPKQAFVPRFNASLRVLSMTWKSTVLISFAILSWAASASVAQEKTIYCHAVSDRTFASGAYRFYVKRNPALENYWNFLAEWTRSNGDLYFSKPNDVQVENHQFETVLFFDNVETWGRTDNVTATFVFPDDFSKGIWKCSS